MLSSSSMVGAMAKILYGDWVGESRVCRVAMEGMEREGITKPGSWLFALVGGSNWCRGTSSAVR